MKDYLAHAIPEIEKIISTEQFKLSEEILDLRFALGLSFYETAQFLELDPNDYIKFEYADTDLSPADYQAIIDKLETHKKYQDIVDNLKAFQED
jgi:hypothetical protein